MSDCSEVSMFPESEAKVIHLNLMVGNENPSLPSPRNSSLRLPPSLQFTSFSGLEERI